MKNRYHSLLFIALSTFALVAQVPAYVPTSGLVGWWPFTGNANDLSGNGNNGTVNGATLTTDRFGNANQAYSFNAAQLNYIDIPHSSSLNLQSNNCISISTWIQTSITAPVANDIIYISKQTNSGTSQIGFNCSFLNNQAHLLVKNGISSPQGYVTTVSNSILNASWNHVVFIFNNGVGLIYVNGILVSQQSGIISTIGDNTSAMQFGKPCWATTNANAFTGKLDDIGIWNRALTQAEITGLYTITPAPTIATTPANATICTGQSATLTASATNSGTPCAATGLSGTLATGLVGYWPFCGNANDESGNGNNGTVNGATLTTDRFGNASSAYSFDGVNDHIIVQDIPILKPSNSISLCAWVNINSSEQSSFNAIINKSHNQSQNYSSYSLITGNAGFNQTGNPGFTVRTTSSYNWTGANGTSTQAPGQNILNQWQFVCGTWDGTNMKIYQNGILIATVPQGGTIIYNTENLFFGKRKDGNGLDDYFTGLIDDAGIWNRALTATEIQQLYTQGQATYSWSPGGATTPSITVSPTTTTTYTCTITNGGATSTLTQTVTVNPVPTVNAGADLAVCSGSTATLTATGAATYSWNNSVQNGVAFTPSATTTYTVTGTDANGCTATDAVTLTVVPGPAFTSQPLSSQTVCTGASLNALSVAYSGATGTPAYQWYSSLTNTNSNGTPISGATNASYTPGANAVGQAYYYCVISFTALTSCSSISSNPGQVSVIANPVFSVAPLSNQTICQGANPQVLSFTTSGGAGTASYQWYNVNGSNYTSIIGANGLTYTPSASLPVGTYNYAVAMTQNASGCSTGFSPNAQLVVLPQPVVSTPIGGVYCQGGNITTPLSVNVTGGNGSSAYQWYQSTINTNSGGTAIAGATGSSFTPSLVNFGTLYYYCVVTQNAGCAANSAVATVVSNPSPVISTQPTASQTICVGSAPTPLSTSYTGGVGTPSYQWYVNNQSTTLGGTAIVGANTSTYLPSNQVGLGTNYYYCVVTLSNSTCPQATTNIATVNTVVNPSVTGPNNATYCQSTSVAQPLSVSASGGNGTSYSYQWYSNVNNTNFGGNPILGANNPNYTPNINGSSNNYYCVVTQPGGCQAASVVAVIDIVAAPGITSQPIAGQTLCVGGLAQALSIAVTGGVSNPSFQWYSNTANTMTNATLIANASTPTYTPNAAISTGTTFYFCQVNFAANSACPALISNAATIIAVSDPAVSNPANANYCQNATSAAPLSVTASGGINTSYLYQWYSNTNNSNVGGSPIAGANTSTYVPLVNQVGTIYYYCEVTQGSGCDALSGVSTVAVGVAANINLQPTSSQNICLGQATSPLTVGVSAGNYALNYQWYSNVTNNNFGGSVIVGATNAFYTPPSNTLGTKYYYCVITIAGGGCGNLTSNTAGITVLSAPTMFQPNSQTICCQSSTTPINFVGNASNYSWTANSSSPQLTGFSSLGGGNIPALILTNNSATPQNIVYLVTPSNAGCNGTPVQFNISVMPCLSVNVPADQSYCAGETVSSNVFTGVGQTYSWVNTNTTVGLQNAGINFVPNFVAQNTTATTQIATIIVTPNFMGCAGTAQSYSISVYPLPTVDAGVDQEICSGGNVTLTANGAPNLVWDNGILNGQPFVPNATTTYTVTGTDANGCQNSDVVVVTVNNPTSATLNVTSCDAYTLNGQTYTSSGTYSQLLTNSNGCDSTLTLNLTLNFSPSQPNVYVQNQINLSTDLTPGLTYQWIQCTDLTPIAGQTAITYNPTSNGVYAVVVTNGCGSDTSLCTSITTIGLDEHLSSQILLYPNPNNGVFTLEMPQVLIGQTIQIFDMSGRLIQETTAQEMKQHIELKEVATGSYWLRIGSEIPMKLIKH